MCNKPRKNAIFPFWPCRMTTLWRICCCAGDTVINFAVHPEFFTAKYSSVLGRDLAAARAAAVAGAHFVMCSTRRVYPESCRFGACETDTADGDETTYGRNKAMSEEAVRAVSGTSLILQL